MRTRICDQVSCNDPAGPIEAVEAIGDSDERGADDGDFDIDQVNADHQTGQSQYSFSRLCGGSIPKSGNIQPPSFQIDPLIILNSQYFKALGGGGCRNILDILSFGLSCCWLFCCVCWSGLLKHP